MLLLQSWLGPPSPADWALRSHTHAGSDSAAAHKESFLAGVVLAARSDSSLCFSGPTLAALTITERVSVLVRS